LHFRAFFKLLAVYLFIFTPKKLKKPQLRGYVICKLKIKTS